MSKNYASFKPEAIAFIESLNEIESDASFYRRYDCLFPGGRKEKYTEDQLSALDKRLPRLMRCCCISSFGDDNVTALKATLDFNQNRKDFHPFELAGLHAKGSTFWFKSIARITSMTADTLVARVPLRECAYDRQLGFYFVSSFRQEEVGLRKSWFERQLKGSWARAQIAYALGISRKDFLDYAFSREVVPAPAPLPETLELST